MTAPFRNPSFDLRNKMTKSSRKTIMLASLLAAILPRAPIPARSLGQASSGSALSQVDTVELQVRVMDFSSVPEPWTVIFRYTPLVNGAGGRAEVQRWKFAWKLHADFSNLPAASQLCGECLTYVLWSVSPEGRTSNLGEITLTGTEGSIDTKVSARRLGMIVTAEPYFAVSQPSKAVTLQADVGPGTTPTVPVTQVACNLRTLPLGVDPAASKPAGADDPAGPLLFEEARRAIAAARRAGAEQYAPDTLHTAEQLLRLAQDQQAAGAPKKDVTDTGSEAVLIAEDARVLAVTRRAHQAPTSTGPSP
jgi:hypothetical protein